MTENADCPKPISIKDKIKAISEIVGLDPAWVLAIAEVESSMGVNQLSPTGARGVFQMTSIAMAELLRIMVRKDDEWADILCGIAYLNALKNQWGSEDSATIKFCNPKDRDFYLSRVRKAREKFNGEVSGAFGRPLE